MKNSISSVVVMAAVFAVGVSACSKPYRDQVRQQEFTAIESYFTSQKLTVWKYDDARYAVVEPGDSINTREGDILTLYYSLFALSNGQLTLLSTNDTASARAYKLPAQAFSDEPLNVEIGTTPLIRGLELGLKNYAHLGGSAWIGIPSDLAFGRGRFGSVPANTPILCHISVVDATSERVPPSQ